MDPIARARRRFGLFVGFVLMSATGAFFVLRHVPLSAEALRAMVLSWGPLAPLAYIGLMTLRPIIFFPSILLFVAAGLAFGPWLGTLYAVIGGVLAAVITYLLARSLGREFVQARLPARLQRFQNAELGAGLVFLLNLVPIVPITAVNYGAGLSRVPLAHYTLAVIGGLTPRAFAYTYFGDALLDSDWRQLLIAGAAIGVLVLIPAIFHKRWLKHWQ